ncbi:hypothetical protein V6N12_039454 [Hibiscus sabdariffa]|uniref:Uncharacterized protein n=1 Tax=Hibiscus sabdariffa TaxID=183260 RepID=A0ABR2E2H0_9ROSI
MQFLILCRFAFRNALKVANPGFSLYKLSVEGKQSGGSFNGHVCAVYIFILCSDLNLGLGSPSSRKPVFSEKGQENKGATALEKMLPSNMLKLLMVFKTPPISSHTIQFLLGHILPLEAVHRWSLCVSPYVPKSLTGKVT